MILTSQCSKRILVIRGKERRLSRARLQNDTERQESMHHLPSLDGCSMYTSEARILIEDGFWGSRGKGLGFSWAWMQHWLK